MAKRQAVTMPRVAIPHFDRGIEAWRIAHDVRSDLAGAMLRLRFFEKAHASRAAHQAAGLLLVALNKLDELEEEDTGLSMQARLRSEARRVGHS